jgi:murein L,D-transpeptidase YcbB/YkuD
MEDARVPRLRGRLGLASEASDLRYDPKLVDAVKEFQRANGLPATGNLDSRTVRKLNGPGADRTIETIIANMERWRWYPRDLGEAHVLVNLPDFTLKVMHKGAQIWTSRIVIGEPSKPTPLLSERMTSITLNPVWHVPPSIVRNEYLPALARDRNVLARMGLHLSYNGGEAQITMPAGGKTPLGHINFYNRFMVFQHDTPDQYMFAHAVRAESHGCMRVEHAAKYAELLFSLARPDEHWTAERSGCTSLIRPLLSMMMASCKSAGIFTISIAAPSRLSRTSRSWQSRRRRPAMARNWLLLPVIAEPRVIRRAAMSCSRRSLPGRVM